MTKWIKISDMTPADANQSGPFLATNGREIFACYYWQNDEDFVGFIHCLDDSTQVEWNFEATHWMSYPNLPRDNDND